MAIIMDQFGRKKDTEADSSAPAAAPSGQPGPVAPVGQKAQTKGSGQFTDLNKYLTANKGIGNMAQGVVDKAVGASPTTSFNPNPLAPPKTTVNLSDTKDVEAAGTFLTGSYDAAGEEKKIEDAATASRRQAADQARTAQGLAAGDFGTIRAATGTQGGRSGLGNLTAFGLQRNEDAQKLFQGAKSTTDSRMGAVEQGVAAAKGQVGANKDSYAKSQADLKAYLKNQASPELFKELTSNLKGSAVGTKSLDDFIKETTIDHTDLLDPGGYSYDFSDPVEYNKHIENFKNSAALDKANIGKYFKQGTNYNQSNTASTDPKVAALQKLLGAEAGSFDKDSLMSQAGLKNSESTFDQKAYKQALRDYLKLQSEANKAAKKPGTLGSGTKNVAPVVAAPTKPAKPSTGGGSGGGRNTNRHMA
jgi:hypothetical protein